MQIYFHSRLCSYLSRVPILVEGTVYTIYFVYIIYVYIVSIYNIYLGYVYIVCIRSLSLCMYVYCVCIHSSFYMYSFITINYFISLLQISLCHGV